MPVLSSLDIDLEMILEKDRDDYAKFSSVGDEIHFCLGKVERNTVVDYLEKFIEDKSDNPEIAYPKKSAIAWCSFKTDTKGVYLKNSFQLSSILWAVAKWDESRAHNSHDFSLDTSEYEELVGEIDEELQNQNVDEFISTIYEKIFNEYVKHRFSEDPQESMGIAEYNRYASEQVRDADEDAFDYADQGKSFFLNDIIQLSELVQNGNFGDGNEYEKKVIEYILAGYEKSKGPDDLPRTIISPDAGKSEMKLFFDRILNVTNSPRGKWPAKYMPALMQQVAVNIAIRQDGDAPVFSVNGPPGTGKTTLLKEIVASNIVERARLLAENAKDPDSIFEMHSFSHGPLETNANAYYQYAPHYYSINVDEINNYSMLVASCNNAAVENITIDLPKAKDILDSLESSGDDEEEIRAAWMRSVICLISTSQVMWRL